MYTSKDDLTPLLYSGKIIIKKKKKRKKKIILKWLYYVLERGEHQECVLMKWVSYWQKILF